MLEGRGTVGKVLLEAVSRSAAVRYGASSVSRATAARQQSRNVL